MRCNFEVESICQATNWIKHEKTSIESIDSGGSNFTQEDVTELEVKNIRWYSIPNKIGEFFPNIDVFSIVSANLRSIEKENFMKLTLISELKLSDNEISKFNENTFEDLVNLRKLHLGNNSLVYVYEKSFSSMLSLTNIYLHYNLIEFLPKYLFRHNLKLRIIRLDHNKIVFIDERMFDYLNFVKHLDLQKNVCIDAIKAKELQTDLKEKISAKCDSDDYVFKKITDCKQILAKCKSSRGKKSVLDVKVFRIVFGDWRF